MIKGILFISSSKHEVNVPVTEEERLEGMDKYSGPLVYLYCCEKDLVFRGCKNKVIDIAFAERDGSQFKALKVVHGLCPGEEVRARAEAVVEADEGWMAKNKIGAGTRFGISVQFMNAFANAAYLMRRKSDRENSVDTDYEMAKEIFMYGFRGNELIDALKEIGFGDEKIREIIARLEKEFGEMKDIIQFNKEV